MRPAATDPATQLLQQFFTANLNSLTGANTTVIDPLLVEAGTWLSEHPRGVQLSSAEEEEASRLALSLSRFNNTWSISCAYDSET